MRWRVLAVVGGAAAVVGFLLVSFVAFELWGTGLLTAQAQSRLRAELDSRLPAAAARGDAKAGPRAAPDPRPPGSVPTPPAVAAAQPTPAVGQPVASIDIPSIGLDMVVVQGVAAAQLALGPGHYPGTPLPGEAGNVAIAGRRTTYLHPFYNLTAVRPGTEVILTTGQGVFVYVVGSASAVAPTDVAVIGPSAGDTLTLTTCNPRYSAATRLVVRATLASSQLAPGSDPPVPDGTGPDGTGPRTTVGHRPLPDAGRGSTGPGPLLPRLAPVVGWGVGVAACAVGTWLVARSRRRRWALWLAGSVATSVVLFFFYASLAPVLPASL